MTDYYVDFSAVNDGDGSTYTQAAIPGGAGAYNTLASKTFASADNVWLRRKSKTVTATHTFNQAGVIYIGWPKSGDPKYATRPSGAQATWDGDSADFAEIKCTATVTTTLISVATAAAQEFHGLQFTMAITTSTAVDAVQVAIGANFYRCKFESQNNASSSARYALQVTATGLCKFSGCIFLYSGTSTGSTSATAFYLNTAGTVECVSCTFSQTSTSWTGTGAFMGLFAQNGTTGLAYMIGCTFSAASTNFAGTTGVINLAGTFGALFYWQDCSVTIAAGRSLNGGANHAIHGVRISFPAVKEINLLGSATYLHISSFVQTIASTFGIILGGSNMLIVGNNITFNAGNSSGDVDLGSLAKTNRCLFQNTTFANATPFGATPGEIGGVWSVDHGGTNGLWKFYGKSGTATSNNVARVTGESFSIKYDMDSGSPGDALWRGLQPTLPGLETIWVAVPGSASTVTVYGAYKGYGGTPPDASDIWLALDYFDQASGARRAFASSRDDTMIPAALTSDSSSWTGDTGLTSFKLELTFTPGQSGMVPVRVYTKKRTASAYFYIDPKPIVT